MEAVAKTIPNLDILFKAWQRHRRYTKDDGVYDVSFGRFYLPSLKRRKAPGILIPRCEPGE